MNIRSITGLLSLLILAAATAPAQAAGPNFTFFFTADTHYGLDLLANNEANDKATIARMNSLPGTPMPASLGGTVGTPLGVLVAGDLTDTPEQRNFYGIHVGAPFLRRDGFNDDYAVDGSGLLHYPVYEGYGNHDVDNTTHSYTLDGIKARNAERDVTNLDANQLNYSWDWQGVHFVNLNIYAGETDRSAHSLSFLINDLATYVGNSNRPVVLMQHFGFDSFSLDWWTDAERQAFANAIAGYNIAGIFHGHLHDSFKYQWNGYDIFDGSAAKDGNFLVVQFHDGKMDVAAREGNQWGFTFSKQIQVPEPATWVLGALGFAALVGLAWKPRSNSLAGTSS